MKQTSIDWLVSVLAHNDIIDHKLLSTREDKYKLYKRLVEQAKEMHKEEIIKSNYDGQYLHSKSVTNSMLMDNAEQYYNETFNTDKL